MCYFKESYVNKCSLSKSSRELLDDDFDVFVSYELNHMFNTAPTIQKHVTVMCLTDIRVWQIISLFDDDRSTMYLFLFVLTMHSFSHRQRRSVNPLHVSSLLLDASVSVCNCFVIFSLTVKNVCGSVSACTISTLCLSLFVCIVICASTHTCI